MSSIAEETGLRDDHEDPAPSPADEDLQHQRAVLSTDPVGLETAEKASRKDWTEFQARYTDLQHQISSLQDQVRRSEQEKDEIRSTNRTLQDEATQGQCHVWELESAMASLQASTKTLQVEKAQVQSQVTDLQSDKTNLLAHNDGLHTEYQSLRDAYTAQRARSLRKTTAMFVRRPRVWTMVRVRPPNRMVDDGELLFSPSSHPEEGVLLLHPKRGDRSLAEVEDSAREPDRLHFDHVFPAHATNRDVYDEVEALIQPFLDGKDVVLMMDGHTGTGKSYTMYHPGDGVAVLAAQRILGALAAKDVLSCWSLEVYQSQYTDLIQPGNTIRSLEKGPTGQAERQVQTAEALSSLLSTAHSHRKTTSTHRNADSSRGHLVSCLSLTRPGKSGKMKSTLHLIDLAGAEGREDTRTSEQSAETGMIIKSRAAWHRILITVMEQSDPHKLVAGTQSSDV